MKTLCHDHALLLPSGPDLTQTRPDLAQLVTSLIGTSVHTTAHISAARPPLYLLFMLLVLLNTYLYDPLYAGP